MITFTDVTLTYPDGTSHLTAVDDVSFEAPQGAVTVVTGPSGSGKSSLLSLAAGLISPDSGSIVIGDSDLTGLTSKARDQIRLERIGVMFQQPQLIGSLSIVSQLTIVSRLSGGTQVTRDAAMALLDAVGLAETADRLPRELSGGQRQRVNLARALAREPEVLLVDEPTSALDVARGDQIIDVIEELTESRGIATMLVTHEQRHVNRFSRILRMEDGALAVTG